jgi:putative MFS transporter
MDAITSVLTPENIAARIERLPVSRWHLNVRILLGAATFFDSFDALAIAFVLPALIGPWNLHFSDIGLLISSGYFGQLIGATFFGWMGERYGRVKVLNWTVAILSVFGLACAFAWGYWSLVAFRFLQGLGLGGEIPLAATYINEIAKSGRRGHFVLMYQNVFPLGIMMSAVVSALVVPNFGWQWMFVIGAVPAFLILPLRRMVPESPRWLARHGHLAEADRVVSGLEARIARETGKPLPPIPAEYPAESNVRARWRDLFSGIYTPRTISIWIMWFCSASISYGLQTWLPTILRSVYKMSVSESLWYNVAGYAGLFTVCVISALIIDRVGRRPLFLFGFLAASALLVWLWLTADHSSAVFVMAAASLTSTMTSIMQLGFWVYAPEIYPTRMRALGTGAASAWARVSSVVMPSIVGGIMAHGTFSTIFLMFAVVGLVGAALVYFFAVETSRRPLEEVSP